MRVAAFGTAAELKSLLDRGLDPNSRTEGGTSLLMMAAPDLAKMKLLIERGADVKAKAKSGYTALMAASVYRGSAGSLRLLLDHGAEAAPGKGVLFNASPLMLASIACDSGNVALLHARGADANRKMLLLGFFPSSPLMMASITGDLPTVWALLAAGVPVNQADKFGYTPLLDASTVDFGDSRMVDLLLRSGANPNLRNKQGKSPMSQAKAYKFNEIQEALARAGARE